MLQRKVIQQLAECPKARTAIKFLVEEGRYDFVESGSLLDINYKDIPSYPVGFEDEVVVYPLDFEEFLWAKGIDTSVIDLLDDCFKEKRPVPEVVHEQIFRCWREYLVVGGMPDVVQTFVSQDDFGHVVQTQRSIMATYRADIAKYAGKDKVVVRQIMDAIPAELGKQDKRFILANLEKGASRRKYEIPLHYYDKKSRKELDFVYSDNGKINIIEVKSGKDYHRHASLDATRESFGNKIGSSIVFGPCNIEHSDNTTYLPLYMAMFIQQ